MGPSSSSNRTLTVASTDSTKKVIFSALPHCKKRGVVPSLFKRPTLKLANLRIFLLGKYSPTSSRPPVPDTVRLNNTCWSSHRNSQNGQSVKKLSVVNCPENKSSQCINAALYELASRRCVPRNLCSSKVGQIQLILAPSLWRYSRTEPVAQSMYFNVDACEFELQGFQRAVQAILYAPLFIRY